MQEAHRWRVELGKAREQCVIWEGAVQRGHEHARQLKKAHEQELASLAQAQELRSESPRILFASEKLSAIKYRLSDLI